MLELDSDSRLKVRAFLDGSSETATVRLSGDPLGTIDLSGTPAVRLDRTADVRLDRTAFVTLDRTASVRLDGTTAFVTLDRTAAVRLDATAFVTLDRTASVRLDATAAVRLDGTSSFSPTLPKTLDRAVSAMAGNTNRVFVTRTAARRIRVTSWEAQVTANSDLMTFQWRSGSAAGTNLGILWSLASREGVLASGVPPPAFLFQTEVSAHLFASISGSGVLNAAASFFTND